MPTKRSFVSPRARNSSRWKFSKPDCVVLSRIKDLMPEEAGIRGEERREEKGW